MNELLNDPQSLGVIVGLLLPLLTSVVEQPSMPRGVRVGIAVVASLVAGTTTVLIAGDFDTSAWLATVAAVLVAAQASYESIWKPTGLAAKIENATTRGAANRAPQAESVSAPGERAPYVGDGGPGTRVL